MIRNTYYIALQFIIHFLISPWLKKMIIPEAWYSFSWISQCCSFNELDDIVSFSIFDYTWIWPSDLVFPSYLWLYRARTPCLVRRRKVLATRVLMWGRWVFLFAGMLAHTLSPCVNTNLWRKALYWLKSIKLQCMPSFDSWFSWLIQFYKRRSFYFHAFLPNYKQYCIV